jgi:anaerobic carbon-monoxide dehydrogenase iron sulfur subunit
MKRIWVDGDKCLGCKSCELACAVERNSVSKTLAGAVREAIKPMARVAVGGDTGHSFPVQCRHCQDAACIAVCPSGAMQHRADSDTVVIDAAKCRGCWMCVMACTFGAVQPLSGFKIAAKCDACVDMAEPACVAACPTGALLHGDEDIYRQVLSAKRTRLALAARVTERTAAISVDLR